MKKTTTLRRLFLRLCILLFGVNIHAQTIGPWDIGELRQVPNWRTSNNSPVAGVTGMLYESIDYLNNKVEVFAYYDKPNGTPPAGGWPAVIFVAGGVGLALPEAVEYWVDRGYAAISMDTWGQYPDDSPTPNPGPKRAGVWNDYQKPVEDQWFYHAVAQVVKAHSLIASFSDVNANKIGVMGASWGGTISSTVMGIDDRLAWAMPIYGAGFLDGADGHQGESITPAKGNVVNTYFDGMVYFDNVDFPTFWINGQRDFHFSMSSNQLSSRAVNGSATLYYIDGFGHGNPNFTTLEEPFIFAESVVNGGQTLPEVNKPYINGNTAYVTASAAAGLGTGKMFYTLDGDAVGLNEKNWSSKNASRSGNTYSTTIPSNAEYIIFEIKDSRGYSVSSEYLDTDETGGGDTGGGEDGNLALGGTATQSTTLNGAEASRAIDGNTAGNFGGGSVTAAQGPNAWWQVVMVNEQSIGEITIYNRTDGCCTDRLSDFTVTVIDNNGITTYSETITSAPNPSVSINAAGAFGKTVRITSNSDSTLNIAEVEVYAPNTLSVTPADAISSKFQLYPNPVQNQFTINLTTAQEAEYTIFDYIGNQVDSGHVKNGRTNIDSSSFASGLYLIRIAMGSEVAVRKIVKR